MKHAQGGHIHYPDHKASNEELQTLNAAMQTWLTMKSMLLIIVHFPFVSISTIFLNKGTLQKPMLLISKTYLAIALNSLKVRHVEILIVMFTFLFK